MAARSTSFDERGLIKKGPGGSAAECAPTGPRQTSSLRFKPEGRHGTVTPSSSSSSSTSEFPLARDSDADSDQEITSDVYFHCRIGSPT